MGGRTSGRQQWLMGQRGVRYSGGAQGGGVAARLWLEAAGNGAVPAEEGGGNILGTSMTLCGG
jgi:hypothetical protein